MWTSVRADIADAIAFAEASPLPTSDQLLNDVYTVMGPSAVDDRHKREPRAHLRARPFNEAVRQCMREDPDDVLSPAKTSARSAACSARSPGCRTSSASDACVDTPISEQAIVGLGIGAAVTGLRPIVDLMFMDFICVAMDQIVNQAAKMKYMFGGKATLPLTITTAGGAGLSAAAQHSQSLEALLCHVPGLKVVYPVEPVRHEGPDGRRASATTTRR